MVVPGQIHQTCCLALTFSTEFAKSNSFDFLGLAPGRTVCKVLRTSVAYDCEIHGLARRAARPAFPTAAIEPQRILVWETPMPSNGR